MARKKSRSAPSKKPAARASAKKAAKASPKKMAAMAVKAPKPAARASAKKTSKPAAKRSPALDPKARAISNLKFAKKMTDDVVKAFPEDRRTHQHGPTDNHVIWTLGHLASTYQWFLTMFDPKAGSLPESYNTLFGFNSKPVPDPAAYPPFDEVHGHWQKNYDRFIEIVEDHSDEKLIDSLGTAGAGFVNDRLETIERAAWHEGWHAGQLSSLRRALGLPPVMG